MAGSFGIGKATSGRVFLGFEGKHNSSAMTDLAVKFVILMSRPGMTVERALEFLKGEKLARYFKPTGDSTVSLR